MTKKNAITLLTDDHETVRVLLEQLTKTTDRASKRRTELVQRVERELQIHMKLEEEIFYPAVRDAVDTKEGLKLYYEAREEHHAATVVMRELMRTDPSSPAFGGKVKVLCELVNHHADEEEEVLFSIAEKQLSEEELCDLGERMLVRKRALMNHQAARPTRRREASA